MVKSGDKFQNYLWIGHDWQANFRAIARDCELFSKSDIEQISIEKIVHKVLQEFEKENEKKSLIVFDLDPETIEKIELILGREFISSSNLQQNNCIIYTHPQKTFSKIFNLLDERCALNENEGLTILKADNYLSTLPLDETVKNVIFLYRHDPHLLIELRESLSKTQNQFTLQEFWEVSKNHPNSPLVRIPALIQTIYESAKKVGLTIKDFFQANDRFREYTTTIIEFCETMKENSQITLDKYKKFCAQNPNSVFSNYPTTYLNVCKSGLNPDDFLKFEDKFNPSSISQACFILSHSPKLSLQDYFDLKEKFAATPIFLENSLFPYLSHCNCSLKEFLSLFEESKKIVQTRFSTQLEEEKLYFLSLKQIQLLALKTNPTYRKTLSALSLMPNREISANVLEYILDGIDRTKFEEFFQSDLDTSLSIDDELSKIISAELIASKKKGALHLYNVLEKFENSQHKIKRNYFENFLLKDPQKAILIYNHKIDELDKMGHKNSLEAAKVAMRVANAHLQLENYAEAKKVYTFVLDCQKQHYKKIDFILFDERNALHNAIEVTKKKIEFCNSKLPG